MFRGKFLDLNNEGSALLFDPDRNSLLATDPTNPAAGTLVESGCETINGVESDGEGGFWIYGQDKNNAGVVAHYHDGKIGAIASPEFCDWQLTTATAEPHRGLWVVAHRKDSVEYGVALVTDERIEWQKFNPAPPPLMYPGVKIGAGRFWLSAYSSVYEQASLPTGAWTQVTGHSCRRH